MTVTIPNSLRILLPILLLGTQGQGFAMLMAELREELLELATQAVQ